jgi:pheromone shutdown protein TraB
VALANEKFLPAMGLTGRLSPYSDDNLFTSLQNRRSFESSKEAVTVDVRDKALADNIADVYCAAAGEGMNLVVSIGDAHLPGVEALLKEWSRGRIPLEVERSYEPSPENRESVQESLDAAWPILEKIGRLASPSVR